MSGNKSSDAKGLAAVYKILLEMKKDADYALFLRPVVDEYPELKDDYLLQIQKPMDFSTVEKNYKSKIYKTPLLMSSDIQLVFKNCIDFNEQAVPSLAAVARRCMVEFKKKLKTAGVTTFSDKEVSRAQKQKFCELIYNVSTVDLGQIVSILANHCPKCLQKNPSNEDEVELDIDLIDSESFWKVESIVRDKQQGTISSRRPKSAASGSASAAAAGAGGGGGNKKRKAGAK